MTMEPIILRREEGVATVTLNRPEKLNAFTLEMYKLFGETVDALSADDSVRCVVVEGAGERAFCAGSDIGEFDGNRSGVEQAKEYGRFTNAMIHRLRLCRHPTIAKIRGMCVGGGLEIASTCDVRICSADSRFGIPINRLGLTVDYDELEILADLVGRRVALEILVEGRIFGVEEALRRNLVSRVVQPEELDREVRESAERIARSAPLVNRWHKAFIRRMADPRPLTEAEKDEAYRCYDTEDYRTGTAAFNANRKPVFEAR